MGHGKLPAKEQVNRHSTFIVAGIDRNRELCARFAANRSFSSPENPVSQSASGKTIKLVDATLIKSLLSQAEASPRRRMNFHFHNSLDENPQRFLNVMVSGTYVAPHRHAKPPKSESFLILEGVVAFFVFDDSGAVESAHLLGQGENRALPLGIDIAPGTWHSLAVLTPHAVCYEVKPGPYEPGSDKEFAPWAPHEGDPDCDAYLARLLCHPALSGVCVGG